MCGENPFFLLSSNNYIVLYSKELLASPAIRKSSRSVGRVGITERNTGVAAVRRAYPQSIGVLETINNRKRALTVILGLGSRFKLGASIVLLGFGTKHTIILTSDQRPFINFVKTSDSHHLCCL